MRKQPTHSRLSAWAASLGAITLIVGACTAAATPSQTTAPTVAPSVQASVAPSEAPSAAPSAANKVLKMGIIAPEKGNVDYGCGMGNLSVTAARQGHPVLAVDASPAAIGC